MPHLRHSSLKHLDFQADVRPYENLSAVRRAEISELASWTRRAWLLFPAVRAIAATLPTEDPFARAIQTFGGKLVSPLSFPATLAGFQQYLETTGIHHFNAYGMTRPFHPEVAGPLGFVEFLPRPEWWPRGAALALIADQLVDLVGEPVRWRNWWRPEAYNRDPRVNGALQSDHLTAHSVDLDYRSPASQRRAQAWLRQLDQRASWLRLSLGFGAVTTHIGIHSPHGRRQWRYPGAGG